MNNLKNKLNTSKFKQFPTEEVERELNRRKELEQFNKLNNLPTTVLKTEKVDNTSDFIWFCHIDDGMEGITYLIQHDIGEDEITEEQIIDIAKTKFIEACGGEDQLSIDGNMIYNITVQELGYGYQMLKIVND